MPPAAGVELLGGFRLVIDGRVSARPLSARQQQIIAFLVLHASRAPIRRQRLAGSLWPASTETQALTNLRRELHHLRESWPVLDARIDAGSRTLAWRADAGVVVDVIDFEAAADLGLGGDAAAMHKAARLYRGDVLPDCADEWIGADRHRLHQRACQVLRRLVEVLERDPAFGDALEYAQQSLRLDPLEEHAWCALMRCHARRGERATALHVYQQCAAVLKRELGIPPSAATRATYREILELGETPVIAPPPETMAYPLVGRTAEWHALVTAWQAAAAGRPGLTLIRGEAGIGKTRLAEELIGWCEPRHIRSLQARCYPGEGRLAYAPIAAWLKSDGLQPALMKLDPASLAEVARLHPELAAAHPGTLAANRELESWQRLTFFEALARAFRSAAPLALVLDDLQWADADTMEWLHYFLRSAAGTPCLVVGTARAEEEQDNPRLGRLLAQLSHDRLLTSLALGPLDLAATAELAGAVAGHPLDEAAAARAFRESEGHPLFIVERGRMEEQSPHSRPSGDEAMRPVQSVVAERLALLSDEARAAAEVASAVGRDFRFDVLSQASDLEENALVRALDELWRRHIVRVQADERWDFSHDRIREVAYAAMGPARRRLIHRRIAHAMELLFAGSLDDVSVSIGAHLDKGGQPGRAVPFLERAAAVAARVSAHEEAIRCVTHALSLLERLPAGRERDQRELSLRSTLSVALNSARGYAALEVEKNLDRVFTLSDSAGQVPVRWLWAAFTMRFMLGDLKGTRAIAEQALARSLSDPSCRCEAHHAMAATLSSVGELEASRRHFEAALSAYDDRHPQRSALGSDLGVFAHAWYAHTLWLLGDEAAAVSHAREATALAARHDDVYSQTLALAYAALLHQMRRDIAHVVECAAAVVALCERYGFAYYRDWAEILIGWAEGLERPAMGIERIESALQRLDANRAQARRPYYLSLLAEVYGETGNRDRAASILDAAIGMAGERDDLWWLPALYLQKSALEPPSRRDATRQRGLSLARRQHSLGLERRILAASTT